MYHSWPHILFIGHPQPYYLSPILPYCHLYHTLSPSSYFSQDDAGLLRILDEQEWRGIGITQSLGWEHFEVHGGYLPYSTVVPASSGLEKTS